MHGMSSCFVWYMCMVDAGANSGENW